MQEILTPPTDAESAKKKNRRSIMSTPFSEQMCQVANTGVTHSMKPLNVPPQGVKSP
jgi:hypothetical protein